MIVGYNARRMSRSQLLFVRLENTCYIASYTLNFILHTEANFLIRCIEHTAFGDSSLNTGSDDPEAFLFKRGNNDSKNSGYIC